MTLALICFDLDNTLWPVEPVIARAESETWRWLAQRAPDAVARVDVDALRRRRLAVLAAQPGYVNNLTALRRDVMRMTLEESGFSAGEAGSLAQRAMDVFLEHRNAVTLFPGVLAVLEKLAGEYRLAALSNGNADLRRIGLAHFFDSVHSAETVGRAKPDPAMFARALADTGVPAHRALHIGDHPEQDVLAALAHGLHSLWANPLQLERPAQLPADVAGFSDFSRLPALLAEQAAAISRRMPVEDE